MTNYSSQPNQPPAVVKRASVTPIAILLLLVASIVGGIVIGGIVAVISQWFYLIVVFTALMGGLGGAILSLIILQTHMRNVLVAIIFGLLIGLVTYGTLRYGQYLLFQNEFKNELVGRANISQSQLDQLIESSLQKEVGTGGFFGYIKFEAKEGVTITRGGSSSGITFKETWAWIYWGAEVLIVAGLATLISYSTANRNYCENCQTWYASAKSIGKVDSQGKAYFSGALQNGQYYQAGQLIRPQVFTKDFLDVQVEGCRSCNTSPSYLKVKQFSGRKNDKGKTILKKQLTPEQYQELQNGLRNQPMPGYAPSQPA